MHSEGFGPSLDHNCSSMKSMEGVASSQGPLIFALNLWILKSHSGKSRDMVETTRRNAVVRRREIAESKAALPSIINAVTRTCARQDTCLTYHRMYGPRRKSCKENSTCNPSNTLNQQANTIIYIADMIIIYAPLCATACGGPTGGACES